MVVRSELEQLGIIPESVTLGVVQFAAPVTAEQKQRIGSALAPYGFSLIDDKKSRLIEKVKNLIVTLVHGNDNGELKVNLSGYLSAQLLHDYTYLSKLFTQVEGTTIEQYYIAQRIEKVKELLVYDELSLGEIAFRLRYSSAAHLSRQFKKVTGLTPSHFRKVGESRRKSLDSL
ncbi:helix-turn-helix domain-containing protein [Sinomicrobium soli]|uniref:helix-turn-helix domain-containing protein n=1 Tax=Sinomicrobium sp. N-1-3-6 TaxID=2219864 RepID=UPI000DCB7685|nr:AraC family transcriptional regulator [Sinomicrobium sp. N-1-3-6]